MTKKKKAQILFQQVLVLKPNAHEKNQIFHKLEKHHAARKYSLVLYNQNLDYN